MIDLTVAICTYRRSDMLRTTLLSLAACQPVKTRWELLIVDNAGQSEVAAVVDAVRPRLLEIHAPSLTQVRCVVESQTGTSHARNRVLDDAQAPIVLFTDDDVLFDPRWLAAMSDAIRSQPRCDFWGGRIEPTWDVPQPVWFRIDLCPLLGDLIVRYDRGRDPRPWHPQDDPPFYTANLAMRVARAQAVGRFDTTVGHRGTKRIGAEDVLLVRALADGGSSGWYAADALVYHPVPPQRATRSAARRFVWRQGQIAVEMLRRQHSRTPRWLYRLAAEQALAALASWPLAALRRDTSLAFAAQLAALFSLSKLYHALRR